MRQQVDLDEILLGKTLPDAIAALQLLTLQADATISEYYWGYDGESSLVIEYDDGVPEPEYKEPMGPPMPLHCMSLEDAFEHLALFGDPYTRARDMGNRLGLAYWITQNTL